MAESVERRGWPRNGQGTHAGAEPRHLEAHLQQMLGQTGIFRGDNRFHFARSVRGRSDVWIEGNPLHLGGGVKRYHWAPHFLIRGSKYERLPDAVFGITQRREQREQVCEAHRHMREVRHPHLLAVWGVLLGPDATVVVQPYVPYCLDAVDLSNRELLRVLAEAAAGLAHLHQCCFVHRDVAAPNVLIREDGSAMLGDFDSVQPVPPGKRSIAWRRGLVRREYLSPEELTKEEVGYAGDSWSFSVMIHYMVRKLDPESDEPWEPVFIQRAFQDGLDWHRVGERLRTWERTMEWPEGVSRRLQGLVLWGFDPAPEKRPTANQISRELVEIADGPPPTTPPGSPRPSASALTPRLKRRCKLHKKANWGHPARDEKFMAAATTPLSNPHPQIEMPRATVMRLQMIAKRPTGLVKRPGGNLLIQDDCLYQRERELIDGGAVKDVSWAVRFAIVKRQLERRHDCMWLQVKLPHRKECVARGYGLVQVLAEHPHVAQILGLFAGSETIILQPHFPRSLDRVQLGFDEAIAVMAKVARGLGHLHLHRLIHRDFKPGNINLDSEGEPKLNDFDFVIQLPEGKEETVPEEMGCSPKYAAPELLNRERIGQGVDLWSLAVTLHAVVLQGDRVPQFIQDAFDLYMIPGCPDLEGMARALCPVEGREAPMDQSWLQALIEEGIRVDPGERPPAAEFARRLDGHSAGDTDANPSD